VYHLEMGYNEKLEALERELKVLSSQKKQPDPAHLSLPATSKIPKPVVPRKEETNIDRIRKQVESEFLKKKRDDDTYSIEEAPRKSPVKPITQQVTQVQVHVVEKEQPSAGSSGSNPTYTKSPREAPVSNKPETRETTDISESLSQEEVENAEEQSLTEEEGTEVSTSESEAPRNDRKPKEIKPPARIIK